MKFSTAGLALCAAMCAVSPVHAQIYINDDFQTGIGAWVNAGGVWAWDSGSQSAVALGPAAGPFSLQQTFTATGFGPSVLRYTWGFGDGPPLGLTFSAVLRNTTSLTNIYSFSFTNTNGFGGGNSVVAAIPAVGPLSLIAGNNYSLTFTGSNLSGGFTALTLDDVSVQQVPGPLPVLGALAAFGWSRKLRKKIKAAEA